MPSPTDTSPRRMGWLFLFAALGLLVLEMVAIVDRLADLF
jgi:hypothetical protein